MLANQSTWKNTVTETNHLEKSTCKRHAGKYDDDDDDDDTISTVYMIVYCFDPMIDYLIINELRRRLLKNKLLYLFCIADCIYSWSAVNNVHEC